MEPRSLPASPFGWVVEHAETDGGAPALIFSDGVVTYSQLVEAVSRRVQVLRSDDSLRSGSAAGGGGLVPVPVRLDLASVVEILAHHDAGFVPVPTGGRITIPDGSASEG